VTISIRRPSTRVLAIGLGLAAVLPLTACGAGTKAETSFEHTTINGLNTASGPILIRNAFIAGPGEQGGSVTAYMALFNNGAEDDQLLSATSSGATSVDVPGTVNIRAGSGSLLSPGNAGLTINGLKAKLFVGASLPLTLKFANQGEVQMLLPVEEGTNDIGAPTNQPTGTATP
jgi:copper(I)-binding protein